MKIEQLFEIRREALKRLIDQYGSTAEFCRTFNLNEDRIRHLLSGHRNFAEKSARAMEEHCGLPDFYFDLKASNAVALLSLFTHLDSRDRAELERVAEILVREKKDSA